MNYPIFRSLNRLSLKKKPWKENEPVVEAFFEKETLERK